jgi:hypothetical protein
MTLDAMATAVDWLDAYRAGDIDTVLGMYADNAIVECACDGLTVAGKDALRVYWEQRLKNYPASDMDDLRPHPDGVTISYLARPGVVGATLKFDPSGKITRVWCGPTK